MKFTFCKKQYIYLALAVLSACLALATQVFAQGPNENAQDRAQANQGAPDRITILVNNMTGRMTAATGRMTIIANRLETRIAKLEQQGYPIVESVTLLVQARQSLAKTNESVQKFSTIAETISTSNSPKQSFAEVREAFGTARTNVLETHRLLREVVTKLKEEIRAAENAANSGVAPATSNASTDAGN
jgi:hypothetical protein